MFPYIVIICGTLIFIFKLWLNMTANNTFLYIYYIICKGQTTRIIFLFNHTILLKCVHKASVFYLFFFFMLSQNIKHYCFY